MHGHYYWGARARASPQSLRLCTLVRVCMCMYVCLYVCAWLYVYATSALTSLKRQRLRVCVLAHVLACVTLSGTSNNF